MSQEGLEYIQISTGEAGANPWPVMVNVSPRRNESRPSATAERLVSPPAVDMDDVIPAISTVMAPFFAVDFAVIGTPSTNVTTPSPALSIDSGVMGGSWSGPASGTVTEGLCGRVVVTEGAGTVVAADCADGTEVVEAAVPLAGCVVVVMATGVTGASTVGWAARAVGEVVEVPATVVVVVAAGTVTWTDAGDPAEIDVWAFPAASSTENPPAARTDTIRDAPGLTDAVAAIVQILCDVWVTESMLAMPSRRRSADVRVAQFSLSLPVSVNETDVLDDVELTAARVRTGAVVSAIVTTVDAGEPDEIDVRALPAVSLTENEPEARTEEVPLSPGCTDEVALMVHRLWVVCVTLSTESMFVTVRSAEVRVAQLIGSSPVSVNEIMATEDVAELAARVSVGASSSVRTNVLFRVSGSCVAVDAAAAWTTQLPAPEKVRERAPELTVHDADV